MSTAMGRGAYPATRMRRLRRTAGLRALVAETRLAPSDLIQPLFVAEGAGAEPIDSMPGISRIGVGALGDAARRIEDAGVSAVALFPVIAPEHKSDDGAEACNPNGLVPRAVTEIKRVAPALTVITDVALDPYTRHGQDGLVDERGAVLNDPTVAVLANQALCHARAGADIVAPSDMMDGRVRRLRETLDRNGAAETVLLSYAAKYASAYYGPFRDAVGSTANLGGGDKRGYQMDVANADEALHECALDLQEGADIVMVKPAMPCLDIIARVKAALHAPLFAYQVSGEYAMHCAAAERGWLSRQDTLLESLLAIKRAGADAIICYSACEIAEILSRR